MYKDINKLFRYVGYKSRPDKRGLYEPRAVISRGQGAVKPMAGRKTAEKYSAIAIQGDLRHITDSAGCVFPREMKFR